MDEIPTRSLVTHLAHSLIEELPSLPDEEDEEPWEGGKIPFELQKAQNPLMPSELMTITYEPQSVEPLTIGNYFPDAETESPVERSPTMIEKDSVVPLNETFPTSGSLPSNADPST